MALVIDTTIAGPDANSYVEEADADAWFESIPDFFTFWGTLTQQQHFAKMIEATRAIDRFEFVGCPSTEEQALEFPRNGVLDELPREVIEAQYHMIIFQCLNPAFSDDGSGSLSTNDLENAITSVEVPEVVKVAFSQGSKKVFTSTSQAAVQQGSMDAINALLRDWLTGGPNRFKFVK